MKKYYLVIVFLISACLNIFSLFDRNHLFYYLQNEQRNSQGLLFEEFHNVDIGLIEKSGIYGFNPYLRKSFFLGYFGYSALLTGTLPQDQKSEYVEVGARIKAYLEYPQLKGFFFNGDIYINQNTFNITNQGDLAWYGSFTTFFGETHLGYKHKYFSVILGFQRLISSDAIYNHLLVDDYSGPIFALKVKSMLGRFIDIELNYAMVRPHQGPWYSGDQVIKVDPVTQHDDTIYDVYYGKSLYTHKINIRPLPWIRIGICEGVFFLGENLNPYYANPFFSYILSQSLDQIVTNKEGSRYNIHAANLLAQVDFNIGFHGWRFYGEFFADDNNGNYFKFAEPLHPDKFAFILGGEIRGYLFTRYIRIPKLAEFIINNLYINFEYGIVSKYTYARESNFNYEYVRNEFKERYSEDSDGNPNYTSTTAASVNRVGNFLGFMYGPNSDCIDFAIGWRSDLWNTKEAPAEYQADVYFESFKEKRIPDRLFKLQLHFRQYRLGDERDVIRPYYWNEHWYYDMNTGEKKDSDKLGTSRKTEFLTRVLEIGHIFDINVYGDIVRLGNFVLGLEAQFYFHWRTFNPFTPKANVLFEPRYEMGMIISW
ncbi:MAG: hypothetical protein JXB50_00110 [Spirochaetes bacterium]|nr:hypothetical protein [Spirochaetota bacterium]